MNNWNNFIEENKTDKNLCIFGPNWLILKPKQEDLEEIRKITYRKHTVKRECYICKTEFDYGQSNHMNCRAHRVFVKCNICNKIFELNFDKYSGTSKALINNNLLDNKELYCFCSKECQNKNLSKIDKNRKENKTGWYSKESIKSRNNPKAQTIRNLNAIKNGVNGLQKCLNREKEDLEFAKIMWNARSNNGLKAKISHLQPGYCTICGKYSEHRNAFGVGVECLCANKIGFQPNFITINNILNYLDKSTNQYVPLEDYKAKFDILNIDFALPDGFKLYPTFRTQESDNWADARNAFEQSLVDANINWFVYIKFYIDKNGNIKPLVVGKSGSLNVNANGSDVSFSVDVNDGPARRFLNDENLDWCKTQISILPCSNEAVAYEIESKIVKEHALFES